MMTFGKDWIVFSLAVQAFIHGQNPYLIGDGFYKVFEPFWTYIILSPIVVLPFQLGGAIHIFIALSSYMYTAIRLGANRIQLILFLTSGTVIGSIYCGNIDWLVTAGLWMPPQIGLFFVLMKPQIGICVALYWAYVSWVSGGWKRLVKVFAPVSFAYLVSFWLYGAWLFHLKGMENNPASIGIFPLLIPIALLLWLKSVQNKNSKLSAVASPMLAPYASPFNLSVALLNLFDYPVLYIIAWILLWILAIVKMIPA